MPTDARAIDNRAKALWDMTGRHGDWQAFRHDAVASLVGEDDFLDEELAAIGED